MFRLGIGIAIAISALDQLTKWIVLNVVMTPPQTIAITDFFNLVLVANRGISFGLLSSDSPWGQPLLIALALALSAMLVFWLRGADNRLLAGSIGLVLGGAVGNAIDRVNHGAVIDFLDFYLGAYHWPAFNLADAAIVIGVAAIILEGLFAGSGKKK
ncbi:MAG: Lipoprotein signal peptidase [Alphaproteobacteria bacterium MarineAlpha10_Bin3]|nr:MAG: Lipoprotein signal peptidase [Alphaproteobacteria bacterium MarineAlpha10_Bin3]PPR73726.1 MAG: Lipoprotein signal peptidase [Alphaproteobacteria bacterium MarineAlpha4_Bin1]